MNYRCRIGEVDIVAKDGAYLVFVEVKYRSDDTRGYPQEAVDFRKQQKICGVSNVYRMMRHIPENTPIRFDVAAILGNRITLYKNAFAYMGK